MKRTHMSVGIYDQERWRHFRSRPVREKHNTACGTICDKTKATTDSARVNLRQLQTKGATMSMKAILIALAIARGADTTSSLVGFAHGGVEQNPLVISQQPAVFVAQMATETTAQILLARWLERKGHKKWGLAIAMVQIGASSYATGGNIVDQYKHKAAIAIPPVAPSQWCNQVEIKC